MILSSNLTQNRASAALRWIGGQHFLACRRPTFPSSLECKPKWLGHSGQSGGGGRGGKNEQDLENYFTTTTASYTMGPNLLERARRKQHVSLSNQHLTLMLGMLQPGTRRLNSRDALNGRIRSWRVTEMQSAPQLAHPQNGHH